MAYGLNEQGNIIGELMPLLYFSQAMDQNRQRIEQQEQQQAQQQQALELRQREDARQEETHLFGRAEIFSKIAPMLPLEEREEGTNNFFRKPLGLPLVTKADVDRDLERIKDATARLAGAKTHEERTAIIRTVRGEVRSLRGVQDVSVLGEGVQKEPGVAAVARELGTDEDSAYLRTLTEEKILDLYKSLKTSDTHEKTLSLKYVMQIRAKEARGEATPEEISNATTIAGAYGFKEATPLERDARNASGRKMGADNFVNGFRDESERMQRGLVPFQQAKENGSFTGLDAINAQITALERSEEPNLTGSMSLARLKDQRDIQQAAVFNGLGLTEEKRQASLQQMRPRLEQLDKAIAQEKKGKGEPGSLSRLHAMEALRESYSVQIEGLTNPTSDTVARMGKAQNKMTDEIAFWSEESKKAESDVTRLMKKRIQIGEDEKGRLAAIAKGIAVGQQQFSALPSEQQTTQAASKIAKNLSGDLGVPIPVDDILKAGKDPKKPGIQINLASKIPDVIIGKADESYAAAKGAVATIDTVNRIEDAIEKGNINLGPTATIRNKADQFMQMLGVTGKDTEERLVNTRSTMRGLAEFTLNARAKLKGSGSISDKETDLLERAVSGKIDDFTVPEMKAFLAVTRRLAEQQHKEHGEMVERVRNYKGGEDVADFYKVGELPKRKAETDASGYVETRTMKDGRRLGRKANGDIEVVK